MKNVSDRRALRPVVLFSPGAVVLRDLVAGLSGCANVLFVCDEAARASGALPLLSELGEVHLHDDSATTLSRVANYGPNGVVTFVEHLLPLAAELAEHIGLPFHSREVARRVRDKGAQREALAAAGVDDVRFRTVTSAGELREAVETIGAPVVLKPAGGAGSSDTHLLVSPEHATEVFARIAAAPGTIFQVEEFLMGRDETLYADYVSVESVARAGRIHHFGVTGKLPLLAPFRETGQFHPAALEVHELDTVLDLATRAVAALGITDGQTHTEIKLTPAGPRIIEVNGRLGGYVNELYSRVYDTDIIDLCVRLACGDEVEPPTEALPGVHFQYYHQPPLGTSRLVEVSGHRDAARLEGVLRYDRLVAPGTSMPQDSGSFDLDLVAGWAPAHAAFDHVLEQVHERLAFTFTRAGTDNEVTVSGSELARGV